MCRTTKMVEGGVRAGAKAGAEAEAEAERAARRRYRGICAQLRISVKAGGAFQKTQNYFRDKRD